MGGRNERQMGERKDERDNEEMTRYINRTIEIYIDRHIVRFKEVDRYMRLILDRVCRDIDLSPPTPNMMYYTMIL